MEPQEYLEQVVGTVCTGEALTMAFLHLLLEYQELPIAHLVILSPNTVLKET